MAMQFPRSTVLGREQRRLPTLPWETCRGSPEPCCSRAVGHAHCQDTSTRKALGRWEGGSLQGCFPELQMGQAQAGPSASLETKAPRASVQTWRSSPGEA